MDNSLFLNQKIISRDENWYQINEVTLGNSAKFRFNKFQSSDIDTVLKQFPLNIINYHAKTNTVLVRISCDPEIQGDCKITRGYVSFIPKNNIPKNFEEFIKDAPVSAPPEVELEETKKTTTMRIVRQGIDFLLNSARFIPVGYNVYWLGLNESFDYPNNAVQEEQFKYAAQTMNATVIRSHTLGSSTGNAKSLKPNFNINTNAWEPIDNALVLARKYNIRLILPLTDNYFYYNGNYGDYSKLRNLEKSAFWTNPQLISDFKLYINAFLNHVNSKTGVAIKDDPYVFMIETGNELGNIRDSDDSITPISWIKTISEYIKNINPQLLVLDGTDEALTTEHFSISSVDCYSRHFYSLDYTNVTTLSSQANSYKKPFIIGEFSSMFGEQWLSFLEKTKSVGGSFWWDMYPNEKQLHNDGQTLYISGNAKNNAQLLLLKQHAVNFKKARI